MFSRRPGNRFNRGRIPVGGAAAGGGGPSVLTSAIIAADGYTIDLTYDATPPSDGNFELTGTPEFVVGSSVAGFVRTLRVSGSILDTETVTIDSDTLTAQATTNSSTEPGADYTTGLLVSLDMRTGVTHTGDGTQVTAIADQSGNGYDFGPIDSGVGGVYEDAHIPFYGAPALRHGSAIGTQQSTAAGLVAALAGTGKPFTCVAILSMNTNIASLHQLLSYGLKNNATNHYVSSALVGAVSQVRTQGAGINVTRAHNNADEWQQGGDYPIMVAVTYTGNATVAIQTARGQSLTLDNSSFVMTAPLSVNTVALNARLAATAYALGGVHYLGKWRLYNAALTATQLRQVGRAMAAGYKTWGFGCSPARALAA